jgi:polyisoprenoid-binding protein YceI
MRNRESIGRMGTFPARLLKGGAPLATAAALAAWTPADAAATMLQQVESVAVADAPAPDPVRADGVPSPLVLGAGSRLWVEGNSTVRSYSCETFEMTASVEVDPAVVVARVAALPDRVRRMEVIVPVATLECGNDTMNRHMLDALKAKDHTDIRFTMNRTELVAEGGEGTALLEGNLRIAGQDRPVLLMGQVTDLEDGTVAVKGFYELDMTDFGVSPPRLMLGTLRVHDDVIVHYELVLQR